MTTAGREVAASMRDKGDRERGEAVAVDLRLRSEKGFEGGDHGSWGRLGEWDDGVDCKRKGRLSELRSGGATKRKVSMIFTASISCFIDEDMSGIQKASSASSSQSSLSLGFFS